MKTIVRCVLLSGVVCALMPAQEFRATVSGTVRDQAGAPAPGAQIVVKNQNTNAEIAAATNQEGLYVAPFVPPGVYTVTVSLPGFKQGVRRDLALAVGDKVTVDFTLELGAVTEQITVEGRAELLQTSDASAGQLINDRQVQDLPLLGRNPFMLAAISTGVQMPNSTPSRSNRPFDNGGMDNFSMNGGRQLTNEYLLDGVPNTVTETTGPSNLAFVPPPDATSEFKVQTSTYDAQYGRSGGGTINVMTRSGANTLHGALYHYWRNDVLNANTFDANRAGSKRTAFRWNQPGVQFNGPVYLPKLYDGRNRTFFMYGWEDIRSSVPYPQTFTVPTDLQRGGDFSRTVQANGSAITIYDPLTTTAAGSGYTRQAFAGNAIPASRVDPVSAKLVGYIPKANAAGNAAGQFNFLQPGNGRTDAYDAHIIRIDQVLSDRHKFFARYVRNNRHEVNGLAGYDPAAAPFFTDWRINNGGSFDVTSAVSPTLVLDTRVGYVRHQFVIQQYSEGSDPAVLGFPTSLTSQLPRKFFPSVTIADFSPVGPQRNIGSEIAFSDTYSFSETVNKTVGRHALKFGGEFRVMRNNQERPTSSFGQSAFNRAFTQRNPLAGDAGSGNGFASLLLGTPATWSVPINAALSYLNRYYVLFVQDDWRVTRRLTVNLGFRWDYESPQSERYDQQNRGFDASAASPLQVTGLALKGGLLFTDSNNRLPYQRDWNNVQPRLGVAYQLTPRTVLRGGWGLMYLPTFDVGQSNGFSTSTPFVASTDGNLTPANSLRNPFPNGLDRPAGRSAGLGTFLGRSFTYSNPERVVPYIHQFSAGVQRQLPGQFLVDISYVASRTRRLQTSKGVNEVSAADLQLGSGLLTQVANPLRGLLPGTSYNGATTTRQQLLRPFPQFDAITEALHNSGFGSYDSMQLRVERRFSKGLSALLSYTVSKALEGVSYLNAQDNWTPNKNLMQYDVPQRLIISVNYELPFLKTQKGVAGRLLGGWQANLISTMQSGIPVDGPANAISTGVSPKLSQPTLERWFNPCTLTTSGARQNCTADQQPAWRVMPAYTLRTLNLRLPDVRTSRPPQIDMSIFKTFPIRERLRIQFRAEAFNAFNTTWFGNPSTSINSSAFGVVTPTQTNDPRSMQLALKLLF